MLYRVNRSSLAYSVLFFIMMMRSTSCLICGTSFLQRRSEPRCPRSAYSDPACSSRNSRRRTGVENLTCGLQITVRIRGKKTREEDYTNQAYEEYAKRLRPVLALETHWHKTDQELEAAVRRDSGVVVCLDERGREMDSPSFASFLFSKLEEGGSRLTFAVGGAEGLPPGLKDNPPPGGNVISLSRMTFTHLWARALLAEQIYRACEIRKGTSYHKD